jgi:hypothetical protein
MKCLILTVYTQNLSKCCTCNTIELPAKAGIHMGPAVFAAGIRSMHFEVDWVYNAILNFSHPRGLTSGPMVKPALAVRCISDVLAKKHHTTLIENAQLLVDYWL